MWICVLCRRKKMQIDRSKRPESTTEISFSPPTIQNFCLANGLKICFSQKDDLPIIRMNLLVNGGSKNDPDDQKGLFNLIAMCIDEGAGRYNALQLADEFEMLGAQFSISCTNDIIIFSLQVMSENFLPALSLLSDVVINPHFNEADFNREKNKVLVRLNQSKAEPDYIADIAFEYFLFGKNSPYAYPVAGVENSIPNIQLNSIRSYYKEIFTFENSSFVIVGNIAENSMLKEIESKFGNLNGSQNIIKETSTPAKSKQKLYLVNKPGSVQTELRVGHLSAQRDEKDYFQKQIVNLVLGGQFTSRLNSNLREKNGYTYGVHSQFNYLKETGYFAVSTSVDLENTIPALKEIYSELKKIKSGITNDELIFAKSSMIKKFPSNFETFRQIAAAISTKVIHNLPDNYFGTYVTRISSIELNIVNAVANYSIQPDEIISVLVGDSEKILSQLNEEEFGEIENITFEEIFG